MAELQTLSSALSVVRSGIEICRFFRRISHACADAQGFSTKIQNSLELLTCIGTHLQGYVNNTQGPITLPLGVRDDYSSISQSLERCVRCLESIESQIPKLHTRHTAFNAFSSRVKFVVNKDTITQLLRDFDESLHNIHLRIYYLDQQIAGHIQTKYRAQALPPTPITDTQVTVPPNRANRPTIDTVQQQLRLLADSMSRNDQAQPEQDVTLSGSSDLIRVLESDDIDKVKNLLVLDDGSIGRLEDENNNNLLHHAIHKASRRSLETLCNLAPMLIDQKNNTGETPLMQAVHFATAREHPTLAIAKLFAKHSSNIDVQSDSGWTALCYNVAHCISLERVELFEILREKGANLKLAEDKLPKETNQYQIASTEISKQRNPKQKRRDTVHDIQPQESPTRSRNWGRRGTTASS